MIKKSLLKRLGINYLPAIMVAGVLAFSTSVFANPVLNNVEHGNVTVNQTATTTTVNQTSQKAIINWHSFNIAAPESTHFQQPAGGVALNRISPTQGPSSIYGRLTATGQIILVNPAGFYFGPNAYVNVGGLIASTANISNQDFLNGYYRFTNDPNFNGAIYNQGHIIAADNGLVALIGGAVRNDGMIQANIGNVVLASGNAFTMSLAGNDLLSFSIDEEVTGRAMDYNGNEIEDGIQNYGSILANGGQILVSAEAAAGVLDHVINMEGVAETRAVYENGGTIVLSSDPDAGLIRVAGKLDASGNDNNQSGGKVEVTGYNILVDNNADINVSGNAGGGKVNIGGNYLGQGPLPNANAVVMRDEAKINASAFSIGDGGEVIVWSDNYTNVSGEISATGGEQSGDGGFVETSSKNVLHVGNISIDTSASNGNTGTWLLDPTDIYIANSQGNATAAGMVGTDSSANTGSGGNPDIFAASGAVGDSFLSTGNIETALASTNVTVQTANASGVGNGDITVVDGITWTSTNTLLLQADNDIFINAGISGINGSLNLSARNNPQSITTGVGGTIDVNNYNILAGHWYQNTATLPSFNVRGSFTINSGNDVNVSTDPVSFTRVVGGDGSSGDPFELTDVYGLQGMGSSQANLNFSYELVNDIDASGTVNWVRAKGQGFKPIGDTSSFPNADFNGNFNGNGNVIDGMYINASDNAVAFIGFTWINAGQVIENFGLTNIDFTGRNGPTTNLDVAGVIGFAGQNTIRDVFVTGSLSKTGGANNGSMGAIAAQTSGGATVERVYSSAVITQGSTNTDRIGGLVGFNQGGSSMSNSYFVGSIDANTTSSRVGGLVGEMQSGSIVNSYSSGAITTNETSGAVVGRYSSGTFSNVLYDTDTSGLANAAATGSPSGTIIAGCFSGTCSNGGTANLSDITTYSGASWSIADGTTASTWVIFDGQTRPMLSMEHNTTIRTPHQLQLMAADASNTYELGQDIDLSSSFTNPSNVWGTNSGTSTGSGFVPIGNIATGVFTGTLDGKEYSIDSLYINRGDSDVGLFGITDPSAQISNLFVTNASVTQISGSYIDVGILVGHNSADITNVHVSGSVHSDSSVAFTNIGGMIGFNRGLSSNSALIIQSSSSATVTAINGDVGGFVGWNDAYGVINESFATGNVTSTSGQFVGGFVGYNNYHINNSYSIGDVSGDIDVGGFAGTNNAFSGTNGRINFSYSTGTPTGNSNVGGFVGTDTTGFIGDSYWDSTTSGISSGGVIGEYEPRVTSQLLGAGNYSTWDISNGITGGSFTGTDHPNVIWLMLESSTRPIHAWEHSTTITNAKQLQLAATALAADYTLANNIDLNASMTNAKDVWATNSGTSTGEGFVPIGSSNNDFVVQGTEFTGSLDGNNYTISNLYIDKTTSLNSQYGLFGAINTADIDNVALVTPNITVTRTTSGTVNVGALVGSSIGVNTIDNSSVQGGTVVGTDIKRVGGFGGLVQSGLVINDSYSSADVTANISSSGTALPQVGGFAGGASTSINRSYSTGDITFNATSGASSQAPLIGGFVGEGFNAIITNAYSLSDISAPGTIPGSTVLGGFIGNHTGTGSGNITNAYSAGSVTASSGTQGGFAGTSTQAVNSSYWDTTSSGQSASAAGTGLITNDLVLQATFTGWDFTNVWAIVEGTSYPYLRANPNPFNPVLLVGRAFTGLAPGSGYTINLYQNGVLADTTTSIGDNTFSFDEVFNINDNDILLFFLTGGASAKGNILALAPLGSGDLTGLNFTANNIIIDSNTSAFSNSDFNTGFFNSIDVLFSTSGTNLTLGNATNTTANLITSVGTTYTVDGTIDTVSGGTSSATFGGAVNIGGDITTSGDQAYGTSNIQLTNNVALTSSSGNISSSGYIDGNDGSGPYDFTVNVAGATSEFAGELREMNSFTKNGAGTLILSGTNSNTTGITINAGTLQAGNGGTTGGLGTGNVTNNGNLAFNRSNALSVGNVISGTGSLTQAGSNTLTLTGSNTYSGNTTISAGTLQIGNNGTTGSINSASNIINNSALVFNRSNAYSISNTISGTGSVSKNGSGTLTLSGTNTYSGVTNLNSGTLNITNNSALGSTAGGTNAGNNVTLNLDGVTVTDESLAYNISFTSDLREINGATWAGDISVTGSSLSINASSTLTLSGAISGSAQIRIGGTGTTVLTGASPNTFTNFIYTDSGVLRAEKDTAFGAGVLILAPGVLELHDVDIVNIPMTTASFGAGSIRATTTGSSSWSGNIINDDQSLVITGSGNLTLSGVINDSSSTHGITHNSTGTTILSGNNTYNGVTTINSGTLQIGAGGTTGTFGTAGVTNNAALVINRSNDYTLSNVISGTGTLTQAGTGTTTLTGNNTYSGITTVNAGTLQIGNGGTSGTLGTAGVTNNSGLTINRSNAITVSNAISGTGSVTKSGSGTTTLSGANTYTGNTTVTSGTLSVGASNNLGDSSNSINLQGGTLFLSSAFDTSRNIALTNSNTVRFNSGTANFSGVISGSGTLRKGSGGTLVLSGANTHSGLNYVDGGLLRVTNDSALGAGSATVISGGNLELNNVDISSETLLFSSIAGGSVYAVGTSSWSGSVNNADNPVIISGAGDLTFSGVVNDSSSTQGFTHNSTGTTILSGNNTYDGVTTINSGTLQIGAGGTTGTFGTAGVTNNAALIINRSNDYTLSNVISGTGTLTQTGAGTTTLTGNNTYSGITTISAGTLQIGNGGTSGTLGTGNITNNSALVIDRSNDYTINALMSGTGTFEQAGTGTTTLDNFNTYTGLSFITDGTLRLTNPLGLGDNSVGTTVSNNATLQFNGNIGISEPLTLSGATVLVDGLVGNVGYTSTITVAAGTDNVIDIDLLSTQEVGFNSAVSGDGNLTKVGTGLLALNGDNSAFNGNLTVNEGILRIGNVNGLGTDTGTTTVNNGAELNFFTGDLTTSESITLDNGTLSTFTNGSRTLTLTSGLTLGNSGSNTIFVEPGYTITISGAITGAGGFTKTGVGTRLNLSGTNSYTGGTIINEGIIATGSNIALGDLGGAVTINSGGTLEIGAGTFVLNNLSITGSGDGSANGALDAAGTGTGTALGIITLTGNSTVGAGLNNTLSLTGTINGGFDLNLAGAGNVDLLGYVGANNALSSITSDAGLNNVTISGFGVRTTGTQTYNGAVTVGGNTIFTSTASNIVFGNTLNSSSAGANDITFATTSFPSFNSAPGPTTAFNSISFEQPTLTVDASAASAVAGILNVDTDVHLTATSTDLTVSSPIVASSGTAPITFGIATAGREIDIAANISTLGTQIYNASPSGGADITVQSGVTLDAGGQISFYNGASAANSTLLIDGATIGTIAKRQPVYLDAGLSPDGVESSLSLTSGTSIVATNLTLRGARGGNITLGSGLNLDVSGTLSVNPNVSTGRGRVIVNGDLGSALNPINFIRLEGGKRNLSDPASNGNSGTILASGSIYADDMTIVYVRGAGGEISVDSNWGADLNISGTLTLDADLSSANGQVFIRSDGVLGSALNPLNHITLDGHITGGTLSGVVIEEGAQIHSSSLTISDSRGGGNITLDNGATNAFNVSGAMAITSTGVVNINGAIGASGNEVGSLTVSGPSGIAINTADGIYTSGNQNYNSAVTLSGDSAFSSSAGNVIFSNTIGGVGAIIKEGAGTLTLNGANTYTGGTTINGGTISVNSLEDSGINSPLGNSGAITIGSSGTLLYTGSGHSTDRVITASGDGARIESSGSGDLTLTGDITGANNNLVFDGSGDTLVSGNITNIDGTVTITGSGVVTFSGTNTFGVGASTIIDGGTLAITSDAALGCVPDGGACAPNPDPDNIQLLNGGILQTTGTFTINQGRGITLGTGGGGIDVVSGTLTVPGMITGANAFAKDGAGELVLTGNNTYSGTTTISTGTLQIGNGGTTGTTGSGNINNNSNIIFDRSDDVIFANAISGTGSLTKNNTNTLTLNASNSFSGGTTLNAGTLLVANANGVGTTGAVLVNDGATLEFDFGGGSLANTSTITLNGTGVGGVGAFYDSTTTAQSYSNPITLASNSTIQLNGSGTNRDTLSGTISLGAFDLTAIGYSGNIAGGMTGTGAFINDTSTGGSWFSGTKTYTGGTILQSGSLFFSTGANLGTGAITFNGGKLAPYFPSSTTITNALVFNTNAQIEMNFASNDTISFTGGTSGTGNLLIRNNASGNLSLSFDTSAVNHTGAITIQDIGGSPGSGTLSFNSDIGSTVTDITTSAGDLAIVLAGTNTFTGDVIISDGIVRAGSATGLPSTTDISLGNVADTVFDLNGFDVTIASLSGGGAVGGNVALGANTLTTGDANNTTYNGIISGAGGLTKQGTGTFTLGAVNTYTGATTINAGTLTNGVANAVPTASSLTVNATGTYDLGGFSQSLNGIASAVGSTITSSSGTPTLTFTSSGTSTLAATLTGSLGLQKEGTGTLILAADNTYSGSTSINNGTLQIGNGGATGAIVGPITNNAALVFNTSNDFTNSNVISGTGSVAQSGSGTVTFAGANTYSGGTSINSGIISADNNSAFGSGSIAISSGGTLQIEDGITLTNTISSVSGTGATGASGAIQSNGPGTATLASGLTLGADTTLAALTGSTLVLGQIDGTGDGTESLTLAGAGSITLGAAVGNTASRALNTLTSNVATTISGSNITTAGLQDYNSAVTIGGDTTLTSTAGSIRFDSNFTGSHALVVDAATTAIFTGTNSAESLEVTAPGNIDLSTNAGATFTTTGIDAAGDLTFNSAYIYSYILGSTTFSTTNGGSISLSNLSGEGVITVNASGGANADINLTGTHNKGNSTMNYTAQGTINLINLNSSIQQGMTFNSPVTLTGSNTVTNSFNNITFNDTIDGPGSLILRHNTAGYNSQLLNTAIGSNTPLSAFTIISRGGTVNVLNSVATTGAFNISTNDGIGSGKINFTGSPGTQISADSLSLTAGQGIDIDGYTIETTNNQTYNISGPGTLGHFTINEGDASLTSTAGSITFTSGNSTPTMRGDGISPRALTIDTANGTTFGIGFATTNPLGVLDVTGNATLNVSPTTSGTQTYHDNVTLGANTTVTTTDSNVIFGGTVNGSGSRSLTVTPGSGDVTFDGIVGGGTALASLTANGTGDSNINANITTSGTQDYNNNMIIGGNITLESTAGNLDFGTINSDSLANHDLTITANGTATLGDTIGGTDEFNSLTVNGAQINLNVDNITTLDTQTYNGPTTIGVAALSIDTSANNGVVTFNNTLEAASTNNDLNVNSGTGAVNFNGDIGQGLPFGDIISTGSGTVTFGGDVGRNGAWAGVINIAGATNLNGGSISTGSDITFQGAVNLGTDTTITRLLANLNVNFNSTLDGAHAFSIPTFITTGVNTFSGEVGGTTPLTSFNSGGPVALSADITTTGNQTYTRAVTLAGDVTLTTNTAGTMTFSDSINGDGISNRDLSIVNNSGNITIGSVGNVNPLDTLTANASGGTILFSSGDVTTVNNQDYQTVAQLQNSTTFTTTGGASTSITFGSVVNAAAYNLQALTVNAGAGSVIFNGRVGGVVGSGAIGNFSNLTVTAGTEINFSGPNVNIQGVGTFNGPVVLGNNVSFGHYLPVNNFTFNGTIDGTTAGTESIHIDNGGGSASAISQIVTFNGAIGSNVSLGGFTSDANNTQLDFNNAPLTVEGDVNIALVNNSNVTPETINFDVNSPINVTGNLELSAPDSITLGADVIATGISRFTSAAININTDSIQSNSNQTYTGAVTLGNGSDITLTSTSGAINFTSSISGSDNLTIDNVGNSSVGGVISGTMGLTKDGSGSLILFNDNTYTGGTTINDGTLQIGNGGITGSITGSVDNEGALIFNTASAVSTLNNGITGSGSIEKQNGGLLIIGGTNTYDGQLIITDGVVRADSDSALGTGVGGTTIQGSGALLLNGVDIGNEAFTINGGILTSTGTSTATGNITLGADSTIDVTTGDFTYSGNIDDTTNSFNVTKSGAGELRLPGAHTHDGGFDLDAGTLLIGNDDSFGNGTFTFNGGALGVTTNGLVITRDIVLNADIGLTGSNNFTLSGNISGAARAVNKSGTSTVTLSGNNTFDGGLNLTAGMVILDGNNALGAGNASVSAGTTLQVADGRTISGDITLNGSGLTGQNGALVGAGNSSVSGDVTLNTDSSIATSSASDNFTLSGDVNGAMALTFSGPGNVSVTGNVGNTTAPTAITSNSDLMVDGNITSNGHQTYNNPVALMGNSTFAVSGNSTQNISFNDNVTGGQDLNINGTGTGTYNFAFNSDITQNNVTVDGGATSSNNMLTVNNANDQTFTINAAQGGNITGNTGVTGNFNFNNIQNLTAGSGDDNFTLSGGNIAGSVNGAGGTNTLTADNIANNWAITNNNGGTLTGIGGTFSNMQNLMGGTDVDIFEFNPAFSIAGNIDGGDGTNINNFRFENFAQNVDIALAPPVGLVIDAGTITNASNVTIATFNRVQQANGNNTSTITLPEVENIKVTYYDETLLNGEIADPFFFFGFIVGNLPTPPDSSSNELNNDIASINNQPDINEENNDGNSAAQINAAVSGNTTPVSNVLNTTKITPINDGNSVQTGAACYTTGN